jgi:hypothetical protein
MPNNGPCETNALNKEAETACSLIQDPNDSFKICQKVVGYKNYFEQCKSDYCMANKSENSKISKENVLCNTFAAMSAECSENFINVDWRSASRCRKKYFTNI